MIAKRVFDFEGIILDDINPSLSPEDIIRFYQSAYPKLVTAKIYPPKFDGDNAVYEIKSSYGDKG